MNLNYEAMGTTRREYLSNFAALKGEKYADFMRDADALKGEKYADFMRDAAIILTGGDVIITCVRPEAVSDMKTVLSTIMSIAIFGLAAKAGIPDSEVLAATAECWTMITTVNNAGELPEEVC